MTQQQRLANALKRRWTNAGGIANVTGLAPMKDEK